MSSNPLVRFGAPRNIVCSLGVSGEFPGYTSGSAYTGTVAINGAQGATRVELVPPGTGGAGGGAYIPLVNGDFAAGSTSWAVQTQTASPGFSFQTGAGRSGNGFLSWQCSGPMGPNDADVVVNTSLVRTTERTTTGRFWARCTAIGTATDTIYAQVAVQMQVFADAAGTQLLGSYLLSFLRFFEVLDWRPVVSSCPTEPGQYVRFSIWIGSGVAATLEFDDCEWDARGIPSSPPAALALPAGFTIDTVTSPDRVRVQWPGIPTSGQSAYSLLHFDGSFVDDAGLTWALLGSPTTTASQSRFGGASGSFAPGQGIRSPAALNWTYSSVNDDGNWTMEFWIYLPSNVDTYQPVVAITQLDNISPGAITLRISGGGAGINELYFADSATSGGPTGYTVPTGQWVHIAIVRERQFTRLYANGSIRQTISGFAGSGVNEAIWIGRHDPAFGAGAGFTGFIDEFRFVLGSALYTGATYTVPTAPFASSGGSATSTLPNLGFEAGDVNWLKGAGWAISTGGLVDAGTWSAKYTGLGQSNIAHETMAPVTPGTAITASCRISKGNNREDFAGGAVVLQWFDANTQLLGFNVGNVVNVGSSAFQTSTVTAAAPQGAAFVRLGASGSRDVRGRASDAVTVDGFAWNHTFSLGGAGGSGGTPPTGVTGPIALTFRVTDSVGCSTVATRTIAAQTGPSATSLLNLNGTNGSTTFTDETGKAWTRTGTAAISTSQSKYGGASLSIPTGSSGISTTATIPSIVPGTDFCIEFWLYAGPNTGDIRVVAKVGGVAGISGDNAVLFYKGSPTDGIISAQYGGTTVSSPSGFTDSSFVHVAFAVHHNGGGYNIRLFVDGVLVAGGGTPTSGNFPEQINFGPTSLWIGDSGTGRGMFGGFIDDFRLTIGSPVYTANFTPPGQLTL